MDIDNISRDDILNKINSLKDDNKRVYDSAMNHMKNILNNFIKNNNFENICEIKVCDVTRFEINIKYDNGYSHDIDVTFEKEWYSKDTNKRMLTFNFCSFGSFYSSEMYKRDYLIILGKLCENMNELESQMIDFNWTEYDEIRDKFRNANYELQCYDQEVKNREFEVEKNKVISNLKEGSKIIIGEKYKYGQYDDNGNILKEPDIRIINRVGKKTVDVSGMYHRIKKDDIIHKLSTKIWKFN